MNRFKGKLLLGLATVGLVLTMATTDVQARDRGHRDGYRGGRGHYGYVARERRHYRPARVYVGGYYAPTYYVGSGYYEPAPVYYYRPVHRGLTIRIGF